MIDSYEKLIPDYISKEDFFRYGLEQTIYIPDEKVKQEWKKLKETISADKQVYMRGFKESTSNHFFLDFYAKIVNNTQVAKDPSNTQNPAKVIESLTGLKKSKDLRNYQLGSIFGRSRNIFAFTAPWNIVYIPKILDPLLSAEAHSELATDYQKAFIKHSIEKFKPYIDEFNEIVTQNRFLQDIDDLFKHMYDNRLHTRDMVVKFENLIHEEFAPIK